jgi:ribosomal protein S1
MWEEAKKRFPVGTRVRGVVVQHCPFGVFVDLGDPIARGLVQITEFLDEGRMAPERYPSVGTVIEAVVLGHTDDRRKQVWLGMKPSQLGKTE